MTSNTSPQYRLSDHPRFQVLDEAIATIATKLDAILVDSLKVPRPPNNDLRDHHPTIQKVCEHYLQHLISNDSRDIDHWHIQIYAYERSVFDHAMSLADRANELATRVMEDDNVTDLQLEKQVVKESTVVAELANSPMRNIMKQDITGKE